MTKFTAQDLAQLTWAFAVFLYRDMPLLAAVSSQVICCRQEFTAQELTGIVWAFALFNFKDAPVLRVMAQAAAELTPFCGPEDVGYIADTFPFLRPALRDALKHSATTALEKLLEGEQQLSSSPEVAPGKQVPMRLGALGTVELLGQLGVNADLAESAPERSPLPGLVTCFIEYEVIGDSFTEPMKGQLMRRNRAGSSWSSPSLTALPFIKSSVYVDRSACAEFQALSAFSLLFSSAGDPSKLMGHVRLHVSEPPCLSCISAMIQFQQLFPKLELHVSLTGILLRFGAEVQGLLDGPDG